MSGHSKWHNIQGKKGKADKARGNIFTKLGRGITVAAQGGGGDIEANFSLRLAVEKARAANMPKDNIERAIKRGTGESKEGVTFESITYEGFGPGGVAMLVETVTNNKTRTVAEVKHALTKHGGSLGSPGSVQWQFEHKAVARFTGDKKPGDWDNAQLTLMDAGADDINESEDGITVTAPKDQFQSLLESLTALNVEPDDSGLEWVAKESISIDEGVSDSLTTLYEVLSEMDDVKEVYTNVA